MKSVLFLFPLLIAAVVSRGQEIDPKDGHPTYFSRGDAYIESLSEAKALLARNPLDKWAIGYITRYYHKNCMADSVTTFFNGLRDKHPRSPLPYLYRVEFWQPGTTNYTEQIDLLKKGLALDTCNQEIRLLLGKKYYELFHREYNRNRKPANLDRYAGQSTAYLERLYGKDDSLSRIVWAPLLQLQHYEGKKPKIRNIREMFPDETRYFPPLAFATVIAPDPFALAPLPSDWKTRYETDKFQATESDAFTQEWYSKQLRALGEAPLWQAANGSRVRFLWLRTFDNPVVVRMEKNGNEITLRWKTADGAGGYEPGKIEVDGSKTLDMQAWREYMARLQKADYWLMGTIDKGPMGFDGSQWILEVNLNGQYHVVDRWCGHGIRELCLPLFRLTGMEIPDNDIY